MDQFDLVKHICDTIQGGEPEAPKHTDGGDGGMPTSLGSKMAPPTISKLFLVTLPPEDTQ